MPSAHTSPLVEHALTLITLAQIEDADKAGEIRESLAAWRLQSPAHDSAYREALQQSSALESIAPALRDRFGKPAPARNRSGRSKVLSMAVIVVAAAACLAAALEWRERQPLFQERYATGTAQLLAVPLPDGSRIDLSAQSALALTYFRNRREVGFERGEARFEVTPDANRPFTVQTREGRVEVVGTIFSVSDRGGAVTVAVERGKVRFTPPGAAAMPVALIPGNRLTVRNGVFGPVEHVSPESMASWRLGWLMFENEPLADALSVINAFRSKPIRAGDAQVAALRLTGSFRANESNDFVTALPQILPVDVNTAADGAVEIVTRH